MAWVSKGNIKEIDYSDEWGDPVLLESGTLKYTTNANEATITVTFTDGTTQTHSPDSAGTFTAYERSGPTLTTNAPKV